ncbi:thermonuclease family protein [Nitrospira sp. Nam74]
MSASRLTMLILIFVLLVSCDTRPVGLPTDEATRPLRVKAFHGCHDGDTCTVSLADLPPLFGNHINIRILGMMLQNLNAPCEREQSLAQQAKALTESTLREGKRIEITDVLRDKDFRILGRLVVDGEDLGSELLAAGLAVAYNGGAKITDWCR